MFHDKQRLLQDKFGGRDLADALENRFRLAEFGIDEIELIQNSEFFFLATAHGGSVDCSFKGGASGFVEVTGPTTLQWPDYDGNSMYRSLGNILGSPSVGLLFMRFGPQPTRLRVNGVCEILDGSEPDNAKLTIRLHAKEIFPNCPRYIPDFVGKKGSKYIPDSSGVSAKPTWKDDPEFAAILPPDDPHRER